MENNEGKVETESKTESKFDKVVDIKQVGRDRKYWEQLAEIVGWKLRGFSERKHASFWTEPSHSDADLMSMTGTQRDQLMKAIKRYAKNASAKSGKRKVARRK